MMQIWGYTHVSSALEVHYVLTHPPRDAGDYGLWRQQLDFEPPVWGAEDAQRRGLALVERGFHVWSWDDLSVVYSPPGAMPPRGVRYCLWYEAEPDTRFGGPDSVATSGRSP